MERVLICPSTVGWFSCHLLIGLVGDCEVVEATLTKSDKQWIIRFYFTSLNETKKHTFQWILTCHTEHLELYTII